MLPRIPDSPPVIPALSAGTKTLRWSVMIPVYNCSQYLPETLESVLRQDPGADVMQIEVVDDHSNDTDVEALVQQIGKGRIKYFKQSQNVGSLRNFQTCINRAVGEYVHLLHGDDVIGDGYYRKIDELMTQFPQAGAAFTGFGYLNDEFGSNSFEHPPHAVKPVILDDWLIRISSRVEIQYVAITLKREVYEALGSFYGVTYGEDWEMWVRVAKNYPVAYTPEVLAWYRIHSNSISGDKILTGRFLEDVRKVIGLIGNHLPPEKVRHVSAIAHRNFAGYGLEIAERTWKQTKNPDYLRKQLSQVIKTSSGMLVIVSICRLISKILFKKL